MVNAGGANQPDKKARCSRVTADVAAKVVDLVKTYLASGALGARSFAAPAIPTTVTGCTTCHGVAVTDHNGRAVSSAASGMACTTCHGEIAVAGSAHAAATATCGSCHQ
jgi:hypothetical protein